MIHVRRGRILLVAFALALAGVTATTVTAQAATQLVTPGSVQAADLGGGQLAMTWDRSTGAHTYRIALSIDKTLPWDATKTVYVDTVANETSITIDLPQLIKDVPSSSGYDVRVRAKSIDATDDPGASANSPWVRVDAVSEAIAKYKVGIYNMMCTANCHGGSSYTRDTFPWAERGDAVLSTIRHLDLDILGIQEDNAAIATEWGCADGVGSDCLNPKDGSVAKRATRFLTPTGQSYSTVDAVRASGLLADELDDDGYASSLHTGLVEGSILYKQSMFTQVDSGAFTDLYSDFSGEVTAGRPDVNWVILEDVARSTRVFVVNVHPVADSAAPNGNGNAARRAYMAQLVDQLDEQNTDALPVVIVGDFNSSTSADGGLGYLKGQGFSVSNDVAPAKINATYRSFTTFRPSRVATAYPYDHVVYRGNGSPITPVASWVVARTRVADGQRWSENCRAVSAKDGVATAGCIGSDHVPVMASLRW